MLLIYFILERTQTIFFPNTVYKLDNSDLLFTGLWILPITPSCETIGLSEKSDPLMWSLSTYYWRAINLLQLVKQNQVAVFFFFKHLRSQTSHSHSTNIASCMQKKLYKYAYLHSPSLYKNIKKPHTTLSICSWYYVVHCLSVFQYVTGNHSTKYDSLR